MRGPLNLASPIVCVLYVVLLLCITFKYYTGRRYGETIPVVFASIIALISGIAEINTDKLVGTSVFSTSMAIGVMFLYFYGYIQTSRIDMLTGLYNRQTFYRDCNKHGDRITAVIAIDMNGLKEINDTAGHEAGDEALKKLSKIITKASSHGMTVYRNGGDEFVILCIGIAKEKIEAYVNTIRATATDDTVPCSIGFSYRDADQSLHDLEKEADKQMYDDKASYYMRTGKERRRHVL